MPPKFQSHKQCAHFHDLFFNLVTISGNMPAWLIFSFNVKNANYAQETFKIRINYWGFRRASKHLGYAIWIEKTERHWAVSEVYAEIQSVKASVAKHSKTGVTGLLIETEMEKFKCVQCGHCCLNLPDAYQTSVPDSDVRRWKRAQRFDILEWVDTFLESPKFSNGL